MERFTKGILQEENVTEKGFWSSQVNNKCTLVKAIMIIVTATVQNTNMILMWLGMATSTKTYIKDTVKL